MFVAGAALSDAAGTVTVRSADGLITDGPFIETKEQVGGYYVLSCEREEAVSWARRIPAAPGQRVEVRPILDV